MDLIDSISDFAVLLQMPDFGNILSILRLLSALKLTSISRLIGQENYYVAIRSSAEPFLLEKF